MLELAELAAGLPVAASFALAGGITSLREGRRRTSLNEAMHELRRPLQVLSLSLPARAGDDAAVDSSLRLAAAALERLDLEINGTAIGEAPAVLSPCALLAEAAARWRAAAAAAGVSLRVRWLAAGATVEADAVQLSQALDNLISNAIEHGGGDVTVEARRVGRRLAISVRDRGTWTRGGRSLRRLRPSGSGRRGHGLRLVGRFARSHGGSFELRPREGGTEARLCLPLCSGGQR